MRPEIKHMLEAFDAVIKGIGTLTLDILTDFIGITILIGMLMMCIIFVPCTLLCLIFKIKEDKRNGRNANAGEE